MVAITLSPLYALLITHEVTIVPPLFFMALLILYKHKNNMTRLMDGSEPKVFIKSNVINQIMKEETPNKGTVTELKPKLKTTPVKIKKHPVKIIEAQKNTPLKTKQTSPTKKEDGGKIKKKTNSATKPTTAKKKPVAKKKDEQ
jgi:glycerol-3-phosphate acyltransferase PlsY